MIREYQETDWKEVCRVFDLSKPHELASGGIEASFVPLAKDEARMAQFSKSTVFVWEENQALRGFAGFDGVFIGWLFVDPSAFRKRIGRDLLQHLIAQIEGDPWLWALKTNHAALGLYQSEGFEIVDERPSQNGGMPCFAVKLTRRRRPNHPPQRKTGSRPSSDDSPAIETPSSLGPRG
jgi:ribosomal protein S18 acetylase RimI-like enzyme